MSKVKAHVKKRILAVRKSQIQGLLILGVMFLVTLLININILQLPGIAIFTDESFRIPLQLLIQGGPWLVGALLTLLFIISELTIRQLSAKKNNRAPIPGESDAHEECK